jgi:tRNA threonylcarbamoyl adenosine modification protein (Sua5/YciO/YrdC/YwlC family)
MSEHLYTYVNPTNERHLERISDLLEKDGLLILPMQTNWVFACDATSRKAMQKLHRLKQAHPKNQPYSIACASISMASTMAKISGHNYRLLNRLWPGPFTIIVKSSSRLPKLLKIKREKVGIRIPDEPITLAILEHYQKPLVVSSVPPNTNGEPHQMGYSIFETYGHGIDMLVDLGEELSGELTTVADLSDGEPSLIREGAGEWPYH